jgi:hypothetical protein
MDDGTDGWMEKASGPRRPLLYVIIPSGFKIGNSSNTVKIFADFLLKK